MMRDHTSVIVVTSLLAACNGSEATSIVFDSGAMTADANPSGDGAADVLRSARGERIFELRQPFEGEGAPVASNNYFCAQCATDPEAEAAFGGAVFPDGWIVAPARTIEAAEAVLFEPVNSRGAPETLDLIEAIDGAEFRLGAQPLFGQIVEGPAVVVTMESSRRLSWNAGDTVNEIHGDGHTYVLFAQVREPNVTPPDAIQLPAGWTHATRLLDAPFVLEEVPRVVVYMQVANQHLWQRVMPPE